MAEATSRIATRPRPAWIVVAVQNEGVALVVQGSDGARID